MCVIMISLGLVVTAGMRSISSRRLIFGSFAIAPELTLEEFFRSQVRANEVYAEAGLQFDAIRRDVQLNVQCQHNQDSWALGGLELRPRLPLCVS